MKIGIYPGTFDPITLGHIDIIQRSNKICDKVIIAVVRDNEFKKTRFSAEDRRDMIEKSLKECDINNVECVIFDGLLVNFAKFQNANIIIRGLRAISDFEYEFQMSSMNSHLNSEIETIFLPTKGEMHFVSSSFIKNVANMGGDISKFVTNFVKLKLKP